MVASATAGALAACSSSDDRPAVEPVDAALEGSAEPQNDAGAGDASKPRDASAAIDVQPLPVVCAGQPCAKSLVTTAPASGNELTEGYCALLDDGTVACWGANQNGQLGRGEEAGTDESSKPTRVSGVEKVRQLDHTCAVTASGEVFCWGKGPFLRSTTATTVERTPVKLEIAAATRVAVGIDVGCAAGDSGLVCWGKNDRGQVAPLDVVPGGTFSPPRAIALPAGAPIRDLVIGAATFVIREDGTTLSWGGNPPLGRVSSISPDPNPAATELALVRAIDAIDYQACAAAGGAGYCWGGALDSIASTFDRAKPRQVQMPEPVVQISTTNPMSGYLGGASVVEPPRWCAVSDKGAVYCWGSNASGQAGIGTKDYVYEAAIVGLPATASQVRTMSNSTCALLTNGKIYCWGSNANGQLGNGNVRGIYLTPQEVMLP